MRTYVDFLGASFKLWGGNYYFEGMDSFVQELKPSIFPWLKQEIDGILQSHQSQHRSTRDQLWTVFDELGLHPSEYPQIEYSEVDKRTDIPSGAIS